MDPENGWTDLEYLLTNMQPVLEDQEMVFCSLPRDQAQAYLNLCQGVYQEQEGTTLILEKRLADDQGLSYQLSFKRLTLRVHSSLEAIGFLSRITAVLAGLGFSVNVISAYYHDHLYLKSDQAQSALDALLSWQKTHFNPG